MNRARAIGREMGNPTALDQWNYDRHDAILNQMRAVHQDHTRVSLPGRPHPFGAILDCRRDLGIAGLGRLNWIYQKLINTAQALALRKGKDLYLRKIQWLRKISQ